MLGGLGEALFAFFCLGFFFLNFGRCQDASIDKYNNSDAIEYEHWVDIDFRPIRFSDLIFKAQVINDKNVELIDGPILLQNPPEGVLFLITSDNHLDYELIVSPNDSRIPTTEMKVELKLSNLQPQKEIDIVVLEALNENLYPLARTTILIVHGEEYDPYRLIIKAENGMQDFIVLDRFYFKIFMILLVATAMCLWIVEVHDIMRKLKARKERKMTMYTILQNV